MQSIRREIRDLRLHLRTLGFRGVLQALKGRSRPGGMVVPVQPEGCEHPLFLRVPSSDVATYKQVFQKHEYDFEAEVQPRTIVDAGANIGLASVVFARRFPGARIFAMEPERQNFELLQRNVAPYQNIIPIHAALWHIDTELDLVDPGQGNWAFRTQQQDAEAQIGKVSHRVPALCLESLMESRGIERIDILKIDIEGAEKEVFECSAGWIGRVEAMIVELHDRLQPGCSRSFYRGSEGFDHEWQRGENVYLCRGQALQEKAR